MEYPGELTTRTHYRDPEGTEEWFCILWASGVEP